MRNFRYVFQDGEPTEGGAAVCRAFYGGFLIVLIGCFTPLKVLGYALPGVFLGCVALQARGALSRNRFTTVALVALVLPAVYLVAAPEFLLANYVVSIVTYSAFLPVLLIDGRMLVSRDLLRQVLQACSTMLLVQGAFGVFQAVYGALETGSFGGDNGDRVAGTIYPHLVSERAFSNPMFAVNMALMLVACMAMPEVFAGRRRVHLVLGSLALVLASVIHVLVFLVIAVVFAAFWTRAPAARGKPTAGRRNLVLAMLVIGGIGSAALSRHLATIPDVAEKAMDLEAVDVPRAVLLARVFLELPDEDPLQPIIGLGPGQFSSRASLIMSGIYLGGPDNPKTIPLFSPAATRLATDYCLLLFAAYNQLEGEQVGSTQQPFFSVLSVYTETGLVGLLCVVWVVLWLLRSIRNRVRAVPGLRFQAMVLVAGIGLVGLIGIQDTYWETPQAIFIGLLLLKVLHANVMYDPPHAASSAPA